MTRVPYPIYQLIIHKIASTRLGTWWFSRTQHHIDRFFHRVSGGRVTAACVLSGIPMVMVTTIGARSGRRRVVPLLCLHDDQNPGHLAVVASNFGKRRHPDWYHNLIAHPRVTCAVPGSPQLDGAYEVHEAIGEEYEGFWRLATAAYVGYNAYKQRATGWRHIPIMVLTPADGAVGEPAEGEITHG